MEDNERLNSRHGRAETKGTAADGRDGSWATTRRRKAARGAGRAGDAERSPCEARGHAGASGLRGDAGPV